MRLFATLALIAAALFWSYPFLPPERLKGLFAEATPKQQHTNPPVVVRAPGPNGRPAGDAMVTGSTGSSADQRR